jgi:hypothetical protein
MKRFLNVVAISTLAACSADLNSGGPADLETASQAIDTCPRPAVGTGSTCDLGSGQIKYQVTLPSGQAYVEVFARQNGTQNVATNIVASGSETGNGTSTYSYVKGSYRTGDKIEYRFYSYLPSSPGVFTPGPTETTWKVETYGCPRPALRTGAACDLGAGKILYQVTRPAGEAYVEIFSRQNGVQNLATNIVTSESPNGNGSSTYSYAKDGYRSGDRVEYRFYSYLPSSPGVFVPGPTDAIWIAYTYGAAAPKAAIIIDSRLYSLLKTEIDSYRAKAQARRGFGIQLDVQTGIDDLSYAAVKDHVKALKSANPGLEGILVVGNVKLPSFFQGRSDNVDLRLLPRYLEDLDGIFRKDMANGYSEPSCATAPNPCYNWGPYTVPVHDLDFTDKGPNPDPELWAAFMPVGVSGTSNTYTDFANQLRPYLQKVIRFYDGQITTNGRYYYVSNDKGERMDTNWATFGPATIDFYGKPGPHGETGAACIQGSNNLCYVRWPMETYASYAAFEQAWSALNVGEGWQQDTILLAHMAQAVYPLVQINVHSWWGGSIISTAQARAITKGGLIVALDGCGVAGMSQPGSPSRTDVDGWYASDNVLLGWLYGSSQAVAGSGDPFTRGHYANHPTVWNRLKVYGDYLGKAHLERMRVNYAGAMNAWELREAGGEMLVGDPFVDLR